MKLIEQYIKTYRGYVDELYVIYRIFTSKGSGAALLLKGKDHKFVAAFDTIDEAVDAILGYHVTDQEGNQWRLEDRHDTKNSQ